MEKIKRETMIFYKSFYEIAQELSQKDRLKFYDTIINYGINGIDFDENDFNFKLKLALKPIKTLINANNRRYINGCKGAEYGGLGGRPQKNANNPKGFSNETPKQPQNGLTDENPEKTPNVNDNVNVNENNDNVNVNENGNVNVAQARNTTAPFPPRLLDIEKYKKEKNLTKLDCEKFFLHYEKCGWKTRNGEGKILEDWQTAARVWDKKEYERNDGAREDIPRKGFEGIKMLGDE